MKIIYLKEALSEMNEPKPFSILFVTCDIKRKTGGDLIKLENVILSFNENRAKRLGFETPEPPVTEFTKQANHYENASRNVLLKNGLRKKFHIRLLLEFNGKKVFY
jgi:hypothetical protein